MEGNKVDKFEQEVRLEAVKAAVGVSTKSASIGNLMVHAQWLSDFISTGSQPEVTELRPSKA